ITQYAFWDGGSAGGHFSVAGVAQASGQWIYVDAGNLGSVSYVGGPGAGSGALYVDAQDGQAWGNYVFLTAPPPSGDGESGTDGDDMLFGGTHDAQLYGLGGSDILTGGAGNDILDGGLGIDVMSGGLGNDTYYVDNQADSIVEHPNEGTDTVYSTVNYTMAANV